MGLRQKAPSAKRCIKTRNVHERHEESEDRSDSTERQKVH